MNTPRSTVAAERGYAMWAPSYDDENAITTLDRRAATELTPALEGLRLLDAACGTGRRLPSLRRRGGPARAVGLDRVFEMVRAGCLTGSTEPQVLNADVTTLPLASGSFDVVWCRLALGHVADLRSAYAEFHRVLDTHGWMVATDFHPAAARAGHQRTFRDESRNTRAVAFFPHTLEDHVEAARRVGFTPDSSRDFCVGPEVRPFYERAGRGSRYESDLGLPLVLGLSFRRG